MRISAWVRLWERTKRVVGRLQRMVGRFVDHTANPTNTSGHPPKKVKLPHATHRALCNWAAVSACRTRGLSEGRSFLSGHCATSISEVVCVMQGGAGERDRNRAAAGPGPPSRRCRGWPTRGTRACRRRTSGRGRLSSAALSRHSARAPSIFAKSRV